VSERDIKATGIALLVINHQPIDDALRAYAKQNLGDAFPVLSDADQAVSRAYGVTSEDAPVYAAGLSAGGKVKDPRMRRWTFYLDREGVIRHIDKAVEVSKHGANVATKVKELGWTPAR
jgi:peroxiredoxin